MNTNTVRHVRNLSMIAVIAALAACGGGGDDATDVPDDGGTTTPTPTPPAPAPADLQAPKASGYPVGSPQAYMFDQLNAARMKCGFGALHHDPRLDQSAQNHADWLAINNYTGHGEIAGTPGFTGTHSYFRMAHVGYQSFAEATFTGSAMGTFLAGEGIGLSSLETSGEYKSHVPGQLASVYHSIEALRGYRDVGFATVKRSTFGANKGHISIHNLGSEIASQKLAEGVVATYPCDGITGIRTFHGRETPNPLGTRDLNANPPGHPVMVLSRWGSKLTDIDVVMQNAATGALVQMAAVRTMDNDITTLLMRNEAFAIPNVQLEKNTSYKVKVSGKIDGKAFENNFSFTTGTFDKAAELAGRVE